MASHPLMRYEQAVQTLTIGTAAVGTDHGLLLFDTSSRSGNKNSKIGKMTIQWWMDMNQANLLYMAVYKKKEGDNPETLDDTTTIRDLRSEKRLIRGPWQIATRGPGIESANTLHQRKTIVIQDILLDPNDDLMISWTTRLAATTGSNYIYTFVHDYWKVTE